MKEFYLMTEEREKTLWDEALVVLDTNSICAMYRMTKDTQKTMLEILEYLKDKLWIPGHVLYEYQKNRIEVIKEPISKWYGNPDFFNNNYIQQLRNFVEKLEEQKYYHPYFEDKELDAFKKSIDDVADSIDYIRQTVRDEFGKRKGEILALQNSDDILKEILTLPSGKEFSYSEKIKIMEEGEWRYKQELPPGYMDSSDKHGIQKYGDLIIWKEILNKAKTDNCSVIFVTNDVKQDWYEEHEKKQNPNCPRHELLLEFKETTGKDIWLYTLDQFVAKLEVKYRDNTSLPFYTGLEAVKQVLAYTKRLKEREEKLKKAKLVRVVCDNCDHQFTVDKNDFDFDWNPIGGSERGMGPETEYECTENFECPNCGNECSVIFHVWEYPVGAYNYDEIETEGCTIEEKDINLYDHISFADREQCVHCGAWEVLDENDLCPECADELERKLAEDD